MLDAINKGDTVWLQGRFFEVEDPCNNVGKTILHPVRRDRKNGIFVHCGHRQAFDPKMVKDKAVLVSRPDRQDDVG